jgi:hypothetical protein
MHIYPESKMINVTDIPKIQYIGQIAPKDTKSKGKWKVDYQCSKEIQKQENGRIYFLVVNGEIFKIGSSACEGGIKTTFAFYEGGLGGSPSIRTFGIHVLIQQQLDAGHLVQIYALFIEPITIQISGITSVKEVVTYPDIKVLEDLCREDYKLVYGKYPQWNFQENADKWPDEINAAYVEQVNGRKSTFEKGGANPPLRKVEPKK